VPNASQSPTNTAGKFPKDDINEILEPCHSIINIVRRSGIFIDVTYSVFSIQTPILLITVPASCTCSLNAWTGSSLISIDTQLMID